MMESAWGAGVELLNRDAGEGGEGQGGDGKGRDGEKEGAGVYFDGTSSLA